MGARLPAQSVAAVFSRRSIRLVVDRSCLGIGPLCPQATTGTLTLTDAQTKKVTTLSFAVPASPAVPTQSLHALDGNSLLSTADGGLVSTVMGLAQVLASSLSLVFVSKSLAS